MTPMQYLQYYRVEQALNEMQLTDKNVTEIALDAGFSAPEYFTRVFKKQKGIAPGQYLAGCVPKNRRKIYASRSPQNHSPELLKILSEMGHGDEITLGDANFPATPAAKGWCAWTAMECRKFWRRFCS